MIILNSEGGIRSRRLISATLSMALASTVVSTRAALCNLSINYDTSYTAQIHYGANAGTAETVYDTAFNATVVGGDPLPAGTPDPSFYTFCLDISANLIPNAWWNSEAFPAGNNGNNIPWATDGIYRAASLYNAYVNQVTFNSGTGKEEGAALQLAIWDVLYGAAGGDGTWNVTQQTSSGAGNAFYVSQADPSVVVLANSMLNSANNRASDSLQYNFWEATDSSGHPIENQDLISPPLPPPTAGFVPESGTGAAGVIAVLAVLSGCFRRKIQRA